jgi:hypothetical protein
MADKYREVKYTLGMSYNREIIRKESIGKKIRYKQTQKGLKIGCKKVKLI